MTLTLLDWRRRVADIYRAVRATASARDAHAAWCEARQELFTTHPDSPDRSVTLRHADYRPEHRHELELDADVGPARVEIATATDGVVPFDRIGRVHLPGGSLDVWWLASYGGGVWLPIRSGGAGVYPGGRYVLDTVKGADLGGDVDPKTGRGWLVVDLNFAYNPSCAYDPRWACPLPPPGNELPVAKPVGELVPAVR